MHPLRSEQRSTSFLLITVLTCMPSAASSVSFTPLGEVDGAQSIRALAVSADGFSVVGSASFPRGSGTFIWDEQAGLRNVGDLPVDPYYGSAATGVSGDGKTLVGGVNGPGGTSAFVWNAASGTTYIDALWLGSANYAYDVSGDGSTVVGASESRWGAREAFVWDASNGPRGLGDLPGGGFYSFAWGVSADGSTVAGYGESELGVEAFVWDDRNGMRGLGDLPGGGFGSEAIDISADGSTVVGGSASASGFEAFIWDADGGMRGLGDLPGVPVGSFFSYATSVSADGSTVVGVGRSEYGRNTAFIWDATNGMRRLDAFLSSLGVDLSGWELGDRPAISADGRTVVGTGYREDVGPMSYVAVIPEPSAAFLLALGLAGLGWRGRRPLVPTSGSGELRVAIRSSIPSPSAGRLPF